MNYIKIRREKKKYIQRKKIDIYNEIKNWICLYSTKAN